MRSRLGFETSECVGDETASPEIMLPPNKDVIDNAADNLDPGIKPPGGIGGGGGGSLPIVVVGTCCSLFDCSIIGC